MTEFSVERAISIVGHELYADSAVIVAPQGKAGLLALRILEVFYAIT